MASVSCDANGTKRVLFVNGAGVRKAIRLGDVPVKAAEAFRLRVEALNAASITGTPIDVETARWVADLPDVTHARLARVGLVAQRECVKRDPGGAAGNVLRHAGREAGDRDNLCADPPLSGGVLRGAAALGGDQAPRGGSLAAVDA